MSIVVCQIPELIEGIFGSADSKTKMNLLLISRGFFHTLVPLLWANLTGCEIIFSLIEGTKVHIEDMCVHVELPDLVPESSLARLKYYAPHIKRLDLCYKSGSNYTLSNWDYLLDASWSSPLLPNLAALTISNPSWCARRTAPQLPLLLMFISPALVEYRVTWKLRYYVTVISRPRVSAILCVLQHKCPKLHTLVLFSDCYDDVHDDEQRLIPIEYNISEFFQRASLHLLSISLSTIEALPSLDLVSRVNKLSIHYNYKHDAAGFDTLCNPLIEWPNLHQLSLYAIPRAEKLSRIWDTLHLAEKLAHLTVHFRDYLYPGRTFNDSLWTLVSALAEGCPNLKVLWLFRRGRYGAFINPEMIVQVLSRLKLQELRISSYELEKPESADVRLHLEGRVFNSLERLEVGRHRVNLFDLRFYARSLPNLKYIRIQVRILGETPDYAETSLPTNLREIELHMNNIKYEEPFEARWHSLAEFLLNLWPNVKLSLGPSSAKKHAGWIAVLKSLQMERAKDAMGSP